MRVEMQTRVDEMEDLWRALFRMRKLQRFCADETDNLKDASDAQTFATTLNKVYDALYKKPVHWFCRSRVV